MVFTKALALVLLVAMVTVYSEASLVRLSKLEKRAIVHEHNRLRSRIARGLIKGQPSAANMAKLVWDDRLMRQASRWAKRCVFKRQPSRHLRLSKKYFRVGQNIARQSHCDYRRYVRLWFGQYKRYNYKKNSCKGVCRSYAQVVWAKTTRVGCAVAKCEAKYKRKHQYQYHLVCNYAPGGNIKGQRPYISGKPASRCGRGFRYRYKGLCVARRKYY